jgi:hypothetical protein
MPGSAAPLHAAAALPQPPSGSGGEAATQATKPDSQSAVVHSQAAPRPSSSRPRKAPSARHGAGQVRHAAPYLIYDSVIPAAIPSGHVIATYATGPHPISPAEVAGRGQVLWIDVNATDPAAAVLDVEPGCATPAAAPGWVSRRLTATPGALAIIYTTRSEWSQVQAGVATLPVPMQARIRWWIADPTGYAHLVPGSDATQWYWGSSYDISTATPRL